MIEEKLTFEEMVALPEDKQKELFDRLSKVRGIAKNTNYACLPMNTKVLTRQGWKSFREIRVGEELPTYSLKTGMIEEDIVLDKHFYENQPVMNYYNSSHSFFSTVDHRWVTSSSYNGEDSFSYGYQLKDADLLVKLARSNVSYEIDNRVCIDGGMKIDIFCNLRERASERQDVFCLTTVNGTFIIEQEHYLGITGNCQYGAGVKTLARTARVNEKTAKTLLGGYKKLNWSIEAVSDQMETKLTKFGKWQRNPINRFWYSLRSEKDRFSTLVQGTGAYVLDLWLFNIQKLAGSRGLEFNLLGQFHDELILEVPEDQQEIYKKLVSDAMDKVNAQLKLNRELACEINFGAKYSDIH